MVPDVQTANSGLRFQLERRYLASLYKKINLFPLYMDFTCVQEIFLPCSEGWECFLHPEFWHGLG